MLSFHQACSVAAAVRSGKFTEPPVNGTLYTEEDWNNTSTLLGEPYNLSKVLHQMPLSNCSSIWVLPVSSKLLN